MTSCSCRFGYRAGYAGDCKIRKYIFLFKNRLLEKLAYNREGARARSKDGKIVVHSTYMKLDIWKLDCNGEFKESNNNVGGMSGKCLLPLLKPLISY